MKAYLLEVVLDTVTEYVGGYYMHEHMAIERAIGVFSKLKKDLKEETINQDMDFDVIGNYVFGRNAVGKDTGKFLGGVYIKEIEIEE